MDLFVDSATIVFLVLFVGLIQMHDLDPLQRQKRIVLGNRTATLPPRPLPIGNLSNSQGEADCYFVNSRFYCISQFLASFSDSIRYCYEENMKLLFLENEEEHEYLYDFMSSNHHSSAGKFLQKTNFPSEEEYSTYVFENISPGMLVKCVSVCGQNVRPSSDEGRVLDFEDREYIGLAVKVQWKTGVVRWYPAQNLLLGGFRSNLASKDRRPANEELFSLEENIFEPGDKVRIRSTSDISTVDQGLWQQVQPGEIGIISDLDFAGGSSLVYFPSNKGWRGLLSNLEIVDKRKASGTYWTSGRNSKNRGWIWISHNQPMAFTNWASEEQDLVNWKNCIEIKYHKHGKWYVAKCSDRNYFICKK